MLDFVSNLGAELLHLLRRYNDFYLETELKLKYEGKIAITFSRIKSHYLTYTSTFCFVLNS